MAKKADWNDAVHLLQLFGEQGLTHRQLAQVRACGIIADVCAAAKEDRLTFYSAGVRSQVRTELGIRTCLNFITNYCVSSVNEEVDPRIFFMTREGLVVRKSFVDRVLPFVRSVDKVSERTLAVFHLLQIATDEQIRSCPGLPKNHLFDVSEGCILLASLLEQHKDGANSSLFKHNCGHIFYLDAAGTVIPVRVFWDPLNKCGWNVYATRLNDGSWDPGSRVICPAGECV